MKKRLLIALVGILMLISLAHVGIISATAVSSQQKHQLHTETINENCAYASPLVIDEGGAAGHTDSPIYRAGTVPTAIVVKPNITEVHVGDTVTGNGTLINKNTGEGIPNATLMLQVSVDGNNWITLARAKTDSNGSISYTGTIPDPQSFGYQIPMTVYGRIVYAGDEMYAGTANIYAVTVLPAQP
jgi:hypothetical protein